MRAAGLFFFLGVLPHSALGAARTDDAPPPLPSGMDLLYGERIPFSANGEPLIAIGLMHGQKNVALRLSGPVVADYFEDGVFKRTQLGAGTRLVVSLRRAQAAKRVHYVSVASFPQTRRAQAEESLRLWQGRGYAKATLIASGTLVGIGGEALDNRAFRVAIPVKSHEDGLQLQAAILKTFDSSSTVHFRLKERPWAELNIRLGIAPLGKATSFLRLSPAPSASGDGITVEHVEYGKGYRWHGFEDRRFPGELYVAVDPDGLLAVVNIVGAETILKGVVPSELFASAPPEALKAQAIAARNHLLAKLGGRHHGDPYHLCAAQHCQVYTGLNRRDPRADEAVEATYGMALFHDDGLVHATYSSTCGGHTEDNDVVWGEEPSPALRGVSDQIGNGESTPPGRGDFRAWVKSPPQTYCGTGSKALAKKFRWQRVFDAAELKALAAKKAPGLWPLDAVVLGPRGPGGKVQFLRLEGQGKSKTLLHELPIRQFFENLNSGAFFLTIGRDGSGNINKLSFEGAGWGHGVGMCQMGAVGRAEHGQGYREILRHYYGGARIRQLYRAGE